MQKKEFINEINREIPDINLLDKDLDYTYKDTSNLPELSGSVVAVTGRLTAEVTIIYKSKTKIYKAEDGTTFPNEFINDYNDGYYTKNSNSN